VSRGSCTPTRSARLWPRRAGASFMCSAASSVAGRLRIPPLPLWRLLLLPRIPQRLYAAGRTTARVPLFWRSRGLQRRLSLCVSALPLLLPPPPPPLPPPPPPTPLSPSLACPTAARHTTDRPTCACHATERAVRAHASRAPVAEDEQSRDCKRPGRRLLALRLPRMHDDGC